MHPSTVTAVTWASARLTTFSSVTQKKDATTTCVNLSTVRSALKSELGLGSLTIDLRLVKVEIWTAPARANTDENFIVFSPSEYTSAQCGSTRQLGWYESWGTAVQPAHLHYVWPKPLSIHVFTDKDDAEIFIMDLKSKAEDTSASFIMRFLVLWRASNPDLRPKSVMRLEPYKGSVQPPPDGDFQVIESPMEALTIVGPQ